METLQINKWSETFESADSRKRQRLGFYYHPSGCDSAGYLALMSEFEQESALMALGIFNALCSHAATMKKEVRGRFVNSDGGPMSIGQIAMLIRVEKRLLERAVEILSDERVRWVSANDMPVICQSSATTVPPICQPSPGFVHKEKDRDRVQGQGEGEDQATLSPMDDLKKKINRLKTEWQKPATWSYAEEQHLHNGCAKQMAELDDQDWKDMQSYMNAHLDQAKAFYQPKSRGRFCQDFADVFGHMVRWRGKRRTRTTTYVPEEPIVPQKPNPDEYEKELAQYIKATGADMTPQQIADDKQAWGKFIHWIMNETIPN